MAVITGSTPGAVLVADLNEGDKVFYEDERVIASVSSSMSETASVVIWKTRYNGVAVRPGENIGAPGVKGWYIEDEDGEQHPLPGDRYIVRLP